jgi:hypothetical protein
MTQGIGIEIENLAQFRKALRFAQDATPRELSKAIRVVGKPIAARAGELAPKGPTGRLKKSFSVRASGTTGRIVSRVPYGPGAEWGLRGKFSGFTRYGAKGVRFAGRAVEELREPTMRAIAKELDDIIHIHGWAR